MKLTQVARICWARKVLFIVVFVAIVGAATAYSLLAHKTYVSQVSVLIDAKSTDPVTGAVLPSQLQASMLATQMDVISSHNVALKVVDKLNLGADPELQQAFEEQPGRAGSIRDWLADLLLKKLTVVPPRDSNVVNVQFEARDPRRAAQVANAFADAYLETNLELQIDPASRQAAWFDDQVKGLRKALEATQAKLSDYQQRKDIVGTDDKLDVENAKLTEIASQLVAAQGAMDDAETRQRQLTQALGKSQVDQLPDMLGNGLLQSMKADLARAEGKLAQVAQRYDRNHPEYISAAAEVQTLREKFNAEVQTVKGSITQTAEIARQRVTEAQRTLDKQKQKILELKEERDGLSVLNREVENAQHAYDAAMQRTNDVRLASHLNQSNIAILNPATPPLKPSGPKVLRNIVLSVLLGGLLAAGLALSVEIMDRRVRSSADFEAPNLGEGIEVLGEIRGLPITSPRRSAIKRSELSALEQLQPA